MQFEEFDNKIREAADHHHPAYDENAWSRMEKLLDKHLPRENDGRRRIIFFLLLFLLLGGAGAWLLSSKPWKGNKEETIAKTSIEQPTENISTPVSSNTVDPNEKNNKIDGEEASAASVPGNDKTITNPNLRDQVPVLLNPVNKKDRQNNNLVMTGVNGKKLKTDQPVFPINNNLNLADKKVDKDQVVVAITNTITATLIPQQKNKNNDPATDQTITTTKPVINDLPAKENTDKANTSLVNNFPEKKTKEKNKKQNSFFFTLSAGPDISATGGDQLGKTKLLAGAGLGYTIKDRWTIRSGFYTGRKIYTSSPGSYHPPAAFWNYYPNLEKVDADCRVYEIPLSLSYNFSHSSKQQLFASAGISSLLMKRETYNYFYKYTPTGPTVSRKYTINDQNKHYFSVLTLSGGYQKNIGKSVSIMVEPYFKLPLSGVGFGKVKLNSGGVLLSVGIRPFGNKK
jgi:hypothetical protein